MADKFKQYADTLESPFTDAASVTPSDTEDLGQVSRGVYIGEAGAIKVTMEGGATVTLPTLTAGVIHPFRVTRIFATGTTATGIHTFW